mgnify:CR=1 FL=1
MTDTLRAEKPLYAGLSGRATMAAYPINVGPDPYVAEERARLATLTWDEFDARPVSPSIGAEIRGVDLTTDLPEPVIAEIRRALAEYKVLFFRDQPLTGAQHVRFAARFGELEDHPFIPSNTDHPALCRFEKGAQTGGYENAWHHDVTWRECPSMGAVLHAIEVPEVGGDTLFADMYGAYAGLPDDLRAEVVGLDATHDWEPSFGRTVGDSQRAAIRAAFPEVVHPVVATHAETGRPHLYVNRNFTTGIVGRDLDAGRALIDRLARQADYPEYQVRLRWEPHTVAFWDNRAVQHYAASDYFPQTRIMERASIVGPRPAR